MKMAKRRTPRFLRYYIRFMGQYAGAIVISFVLITSLAAYLVSGLGLRIDFKDLLPEGQPSVVALNNILKRTSGMGTLNIAIESDDVNASKRLAINIVREIQKKMRSDIHSIDYSFAPIRDFFKANGALYLSLDELDQLGITLKTAIDNERIKA